MVESGTWPRIEIGNDDGATSYVGLYGAHIVRYICRHLNVAYNFGRMTTIINPDAMGRMMHAR